MGELINDIKDLIDDYFKDELKDYKFKSSEAEDNVLFMINDLKEEVSDLLNDYNFQIECELNESITHELDKDIIELDKYRI